MALDVEPLHKVLELERAKGYADTAVIGGLDKFLRRWTAQALESITSPPLMAEFRRLRLDDPRYASLNQPQRRKWLANI